MNRYEELTDNFQSSLRKIMRCSGALFRHEMSEYGVTMPQFHLMKFVDHKGRVTVTDISDLMMSSSPTVSRMIDGLCGKELLEKHKGEDDHRVTFLTLTRKGAALMKRMEAEQRKKINEVFEGEDLEILEITVNQFEKISNKWVALAKEQMEKD